MKKLNRQRGQRLRNRNKHHRRHINHFEPLESRLLLAGNNTFAQFVGEIPDPAVGAEVPITLNPSDFTLPGGRANLGFHLTSGDGSALDPGQIEIVDAVGGGVVPLVADNTNVLGDQSSAAVAELGIGETVKVSLADFLTAESQRVDLGRMPWAEVIAFEVDQKPAALDLQGRKTGLPADFEEVKKFLFQVLESGPVSELEVIGRAADSGISPANLREVKNRLRIASIKDPTSEYPRTLWRLRMSQSYKLKKKRASDHQKRS